jgi:hypothetical protein
LHLQVGRPGTSPPQKSPSFRSTFGRRRSQADVATHHQGTTTRLQSHGHLISIDSGDSNEDHGDLKFIFSSPLLLLIFPTTRFIQFTGSLYSVYLQIHPYLAT